MSLILVELKKKQIFSSLLSYKNAFSRIFDNTYMFWILEIYGGVLKVVADEN